MSVGVSGPVIHTNDASTVRCILHKVDGGECPPGHRALLLVRLHCGATEYRGLRMDWLRCGLNTMRGLFGIVMMQGEVKVLELCKHDTALAIG